MVLLDTDVVIGIMTRRAPGLAARFESELSLGTSVLLPSIVLYELEYGAMKSAAPERNRRRIADFLDAVDAVVPFDADDATEAGAIRAFLEIRGLPIGPQDVLIAAQARRRRSLLVTRNRREFERVPGLMVTDWAS